MKVAVPEHFTQQMQDAYNGVMLAYSGISNATSGSDVLAAVQAVRSNVARVALIADDAVEFVRLQGGDDEDLVAAETFGLEWLQTIAEYVGNTILPAVGT